MPKVLLLEPDRVMAKCIADELGQENLAVTTAATADQAIAYADLQKPDLIIAELALPGHSGTEFLYELRTYPDWQDVPIIIYSTMQVPASISSSRDWQLLGLKNILYKPDTNLQKLTRSAVELTAS